MAELGGETRARLRAAVTEYEQHQERFPVPADDPAVAWWAWEWAKRVFPVLEEILDSSKEGSGG